MNTKTYTIPEFCKAAGVTRRCVMSWLSANKIPGAYKLFSRWRIPVEAIEKMKSNPYAGGAR